MFQSTRLYRDSWMLKAIRVHVSTQVYKHTQMYRGTLLDKDTRMYKHTRMYKGTRMYKDSRVKKNDVPLEVIGKQKVDMLLGSRVDSGLHRGELHQW